MDWLDLLAVQGTLESLFQHHSSKASILRHSAFFTVQLSHPYMTTGKTIALTRWTFVGKVMSLLFNMLSRLVITFLPRSRDILMILKSVMKNNSTLSPLFSDAYNCKQYKWVHIHNSNVAGLWDNNVLWNVVLSSPLWCEWHHIVA